MRPDVRLDSLIAPVSDDSEIVHFIPEAFDLPDLRVRRRAKARLSERRQRPDQFLAGKLLAGSRSATRDAGKEPAILFILHAELAASRLEGLDELLGIGWGTHWYLSIWSRADCSARFVIMRIQLPRVPSRSVRRKRDRIVRAYTPRRRGVPGEAGGALPYPLPTLS